MEVLSPSPPLSPGHSSYGCGRPHAVAPDARVHVAVGRSPEKTLALLRWAFRCFPRAHVALLHVHQPSPVIPTLLGKIPAARATEELVSSHRKSEKEETNKILLTYLTFCHRAQVQSSLVVAENEQIHDGIVALVKDYGITKLVMGSTPDNCFKLKANYSKASFMAKNAPAFCEIWFVWRGRHIWTKESSVAVDNSISVYNQDDVLTRKRIRFSSNISDGYLRCGVSSPPDLHEGTVSHNSRSNGYDVLGTDASHFYNMNISDLQDAESAFNSTFWPDSSIHMEALQLHSKEILDKNINHVMLEAERSRKEAFGELLKRKETESQVANAFARAKSFGSSQKREIKMREELECLLEATRKQHEDLVENKEKTIAMLDSSMRRSAILEVRAKNMNIWVDEAVAELEMIQSFVETFRQEKPKDQKLEGRYIGQVEGYTYSHARLPNSKLFSLGDDSFSCREFTFLDVQAATCKFSESFQIRAQSHGCLFKGEIMNRSVMIHKLHSHSIQSLMQFQQEDEQGLREVFVGEWECLT